MQIHLAKFKSSNLKYIFSQLKLAVLLLNIEKLQQERCCKLKEIKLVTHLHHIKAQHLLAYAHFSPPTHNTRHAIIFETPL